MTDNTIEGTPRIGHNIGPGHNRPPLPEVQPVQVFDRSWGDSIRDYPDKYADSIRDNEKLKDCCRVVDALHCKIYKSPTCGVYPYDIFHAVCDCGNRHIRMIVGDRYAFVRKR